MLSSSQTGNRMKSINLLRLKKEKNIEWRKFYFIWIVTLLLCVTFVFLERKLLIWKIKQYQLAQNSARMQLKTISETVQKMKKLKVKEKIVTEVTTVTRINHQKIKKFMDFLIYFSQLIKPNNNVIRLSEFNLAGYSVLLQNIPENQFLFLTNNLQLRYGQKLQWKILNKTSELYLDSIIKIIFNEHKNE